MGRLLYDIGELSEKERTANERGSKRVGKSSFAFAWGLDALGDERDRCVIQLVFTNGLELIRQGSYYRYRHNSLCYSSSIIHSSRRART